MYVRVKFYVILITSVNVYLNYDPIAHENGQSEKQYMFITAVFANVCVRVDILLSSLILCGQLLAIWERPGVLFPSFHVPILKEREGEWWFS